MGLGYHTELRPATRASVVLLPRRPQHGGAGCGMAPRRVGQWRVEQGWRPQSAGVTARCRWAALPRTRSSPATNAAPSIACRPCRDDTVARCVACGARIFIRFERSIERTLALYLAALCCSWSPIRLPDPQHVDRRPAQRQHDPGQRQGALRRQPCGRWRWRWPWPALLLPLAKILGMLAFWCRCSWAGGRRWIVAGFAGSSGCRPWSMMEVYLLGIIVAYVKLQDLATVHLGIASIRPSSARSSSWPPPTRASSRTRSGAGWPRRRAPDLASRDPARCCLPASSATRWCAADTGSSSRPRLPALRCAAAPAQARQPQPQLGAGADRGHPLHPRQRAAGHDRDLVRQGCARHDRRPGSSSCCTPVCGRSRSWCSLPASPYPC